MAHTFLQDPLLSCESTEQFPQSLETQQDDVWQTGDGPVCYFWSAAVLASDVIFAQSLFLIVRS